MRLLKEGLGYKALNTVHYRNSQFLPRLQGKEDTTGQFFLDTKNLESHLWQQPPPFSLKRDYLKYFVFVCLGGADCTPYVHHKAS